VPQSDLTPETVSHELLHLHRGLIQGVPLLSAPGGQWERCAFELGQLENGLEHLFIYRFQRERLRIEPQPKILGSVDAHPEHSKRLLLVLFWPIVHDFAPKHEAWVRERLEQNSWMERAELFRQRVTHNLAAAHKLNLAAALFDADCGNVDTNGIVLDYFKPNPPRIDRVTVPFGEALAALKRGWANWP
jgi:hypothetical protein